MSYCHMMTAAALTKLGQIHDIKNWNQKQVLCSMSTGRCAGVWAGWGLSPIMGPLRRWGRWAAW